MDVDVTITYVNEPVSFQLDSMVKDTDTYVTITFENGNPVVLNFNGKSEKFPTNGVISGAITSDEIKNLEDKTLVYVADLLECEFFKDYKDYLSLHIADDLEKVIVITQKPKEPEVTNSETENGTEEIPDDTELVGE